MLVHKQGSMDGLCGVYSIINSMSVIRKDYKPESEQLFKTIIHHLSEKRDLGEILTNGMTVGVLYNIINSVISPTIPRSRPFLGREVKMPTILSEIKNHLESATGAGVAIIGLQGRYAHWTVVTRIDGETIYLSDSDGLKRLNFSRLTTGKPTSKKIHQIAPNEVILLG